ncbi:unnamed protein product [Caenorhabditis angaria]|uniref:Uncharacterized protein n=1 Tax=Caenorhabditis angaria TaxID=860376 RepID=A0A9P1IC70_9PELO|nr:unnamed protein product [Caenorhabditis angaria]
MKTNELSETCQNGIQKACIAIKNSCEEDNLLQARAKAAAEYESEFGRMIYTISILIMFSFVIILLMIRSIKRTHSTVEMDALLDAMRFREELDIRDRQRRRLLKAKTKVTAWLNRAQQKTTPQQQQPASKPASQNRKESDWKPTVPRQRQQHYSISTMTSDIPEIVVSADDSHYTGGGAGYPNRPHTPAISLIYDFAVTNETEEDQRKTSLASSVCLPTSSSSSSIASSIDNRSMKGCGSIRTFSLETNSGATRSAKRVDVDDKSFSLDT